MKKFLENFIILFSVIIVISVWWAVKNFDNISLDEIVFHLHVPMAGTDTSYFIKYFVQNIIPIAIGFFVLKKFFFNVRKYKYNFTLNFKKCNKSFNLNFLSSRKFYLVVILVFSLSYALTEFQVIPYLKCQITKSTFIDENYINPNKVKLTFPKNKRNLIYVYLESMESSYTDKEHGGLQEVNYIPNLTKLAYNNLHFSTSNNLRGFYNTPGANWTIGSMVAQTAGIPLKLGIDYNTYSGYEGFLPGVTNLGDILEKEGYNQMIMFGSDASFAGRDTYFKSHGNYDIYDLNRAIDEEKMKEEDSVWWGFDDTRLYEYAKEELLKLSKEDKPFNFTLLTNETHAPNGYLNSDCEIKYDNQYANVISCADKKINDFVKWLKKQEFYKNTTIIIAGDHLTMDSFYINTESNYENRTVYNVIINSTINSKNTKNRKYLAYDLFPTTLASMGVEIEGNKLGLGVSLFSDTKTLSEEYDYYYLFDELSKKSVFYDNKLLYNE